MERVLNPVTIVYLEISSPRIFFLDKEAWFSQKPDIISDEEPGTSNKEPKEYTATSGPVRKSSNRLLKRGLDSCPCIHLTVVKD